MIWRTFAVLEGPRGRLRGEIGEPGDGRIEVRSFAAAIRALRDAAAGGAGGRRQHQPLMFSKDTGAMTPQLAQAACTGSVLRSVVFSFVRFVEGGRDETSFVVRLSDVTVSGHRLVLPASGAGLALAEEVDLTFRRIEWEHIGAKTMAADEWG